MTTLIIGPGGIGAALARRLKDQGRPLVLIGRRKPTLEDLGRELGVETRVADAADRVALKEAVTSLGPLQHAVCCAGSLLLKPAHRTSEVEFEQVLRDNLIAAFNTVAVLAERLPEGGALVLCSSAVGRLGLPNHDAIAAAKAGIEGLVRSAAASYGRRGLRINAVAPGLTDTPLSASIMGQAPVRAASERMHALGRAGRPEEIAAAIDFLISSESAWITGQILGVDGGLSSARSG